MHVSFAVLVLYRFTVESNHMSIIHSPLYPFPYLLSAHCMQAGYGPLAWRGRETRHLKDKADGWP